MEPKEGIKLKTSVPPCLLMVLLNRWVRDTALRSHGQTGSSLGSPQCQNGAAPQVPVSVPPCWRFQPPTAMKGFSSPPAAVALLSETKQILITIEGADTPCVSTSETRPINLKLFPTPGANSSINNYAPERKEIAFPLTAMSAHHLETPPHLPFHAGGGALISVTCKHLLPWFSASLRLCLDTALPCPTY